MDTRRMCAALVVLVVLSGCGGPTARPQAPRAATRAKVAYAVSGTESASLTYQNGTGGTDQIKVALPWDLAFEAAPGAFLYVAAQTTRTGSVSCRITVNGKQVATAAAAGDFRIATCKATVPR